MRSKLYFDYSLLIPIILLISTGLLILRGLSQSQFLSQLIFSIIGLCLYLFVSQIDYRINLSINKIMYVFSLIFLCLPLLFGVINRGSTRWISLGSISIQPSELVKPVFLFTFSLMATTSPLWMLVCVIILPVFLIYIQPDLGTTLVILSFWAASLLKRIRISSAIVLLILFSLISIPMYLFVLHDYQRQRLQTFINPYTDPLGSGYHVIQSLIATGSGGITGRGLGHGSQSQLRFLPESSTDFIFASLGEDLGFIGSFGVLLLYMGLIRRIFIISKVCSDPVASLICKLSIAMLTFQIFVNIGMNMGIAPVTGITLPFLSRGGSSLISLCFLMGVVTNIGRTKKMI